MKMTAPHGKNLRNGRVSEPGRIYLITCVTPHRVGCINRQHLRSSHECLKFSTHRFSDWLWYHHGDWSCHQRFCNDDVECWL